MSTTPETGAAALGVPVRMSRIMTGTLPGMKADDIKIELRGSDELCITGEVKEEAEGKTLRQRHGGHRPRSRCGEDLSLISRGGSDR